MNSLIGKYLAIFWGNDDNGHNFYAGLVTRVTRTHVHVEMNFGGVEKIEVSQLKDCLVFKEPFLDKDPQTFERLKSKVTRYKPASTPEPTKEVKEVDKNPPPKIVKANPKDKPVKPMQKPNVVKYKRGESKVDKPPVEALEELKVVKSDKPVTMAKTVNTQVEKVVSTKAVNPSKETGVNVMTVKPHLANVADKPVLTIKEEQTLSKSMNPAFVVIGDLHIKFLPETQYKISTMINGDYFYLVDSGGNSVEDEIGITVYLESVETANSIARILMKLATKN